MARLNPGTWFVHKFELHYGSYIAFCQRAGGMPVTGYGKPPCGMRPMKSADFKWIAVRFGLALNLGFSWLLATEEGMP